MNIALKIITVCLTLLIGRPHADIYISGEDSVKALTNCSSRIAEFVFKFTTSTAIKQFDSTKASSGDYNLTVDDIKKKRVQVFDISHSYNDSIRIHFPPGGTSTTVALYKGFNTEKKEFISAIGIMSGDGLDYFSFAKKDTGHYFISYNSCHWRKHFWITIK